jgi:GT2 family glycosyltransferase
MARWPGRIGCSIGAGAFPGGVRDLAEPRAWESFSFSTSIMASETRSAGLTVSVVSHGQGPLCRNLLTDLARYARPSVTRVLVTLNVPEPFELPPGLPFPVEILRNAQPAGFGENHNRAFTHVDTEYFAVLNPDISLRGDPFPPLIERVAHPSAGIVAPQVLQVDGAVADAARPLVTPREVLLRRLPARWRPRRSDWHARTPDWVAGMFMVFRSATYARLGGFDTRFFLYCEDVDICARARLHALRVEVVPAAKVTHDARRGSHRSLHLFRLHASSLLRLWRSPAYRNYRRWLDVRDVAPGAGPARLVRGEPRP